MKALSNIRLKLLLVLLFLVAEIAAFRLEQLSNEVSSSKASQQQCDRWDGKMQLNERMDQSSECPPHCNLCTDRGECTVCVQHYFLKNGSCQICDQNCYLCQATKQNCIYCESMKYLDASTHTCKNCIANCNQCSNSTNCFQCSSRYFYNETEKLCFRCGQYCQKCKSVAECEICTQGYYLNEKTRYCNTCDEIIDHCEFCVNNESQIALRKELLNIHHRQKNNYKLLSLVNLSSIKSVTCSECLPGYYLADPSQCASCLPHCEICINYNQCFLCNSGYFFSPQTKICQLCVIPYCSMCLTAKQCMFCNVGYFWNNVSRREFPICEKCREGCTSCGVNYCTTCEKGYYLVDQTCLKCSQQCSSCIGTSNHCTRCSLGYFMILSTPKCLRCPTKCLKCKGQTSCYECAAGFRLSLLNECLPCTIKNCTYCSLDFSDNYNEKCSECASTYYLATNTSCQRCVQGCKSCFNSAQNCVKCMDRYFFSGRMNSCERCSANCLECVQGEQFRNIVCRICDTGYYLNEKNECVECNISKCVTCYFDSCVKCEPGYFLENSNKIKCSKCPENCTQCSDAQNCSVCKAGYYLDRDLHCVPCRQGCKYCNHYDSCLMCDYGYMLTTSNSTCLSCAVNNCQNCDSNTSTCLKCIAGYTLQALSQQQHSSPTLQQTTTSICYSCGRQNLFGCSQCESSTKCVSCIEGYQLNTNGVCENSQAALWPLAMVVCVLSLSLLIVIFVKVRRLVRGRSVSGIVSKKKRSDPENYQRLEQLSIN